MKVLKWENFKFLLSTFFLTLLLAPPLHSYRGKFTSLIRWPNKFQSSRIFSPLAICPNVARNVLLETCHFTLDIFWESRDSPVHRLAIVSRDLFLTVNGVPAARISERAGEQRRKGEKADRRSTTGWFRPERINVFQPINAIGPRIFTFLFD